MEKVDWSPQECVEWLRQLVHDGYGHGFERCAEQLQATLLKLHDAEFEASGGRELIAVLEAKLDSLQGENEGLLRYDDVRRKALLSVNNENIELRSRLDRTVNALRRHREQIASGDYDCRGDGCPGCNECWSDGDEPSETAVEKKCNCSGTTGLPVPDGWRHATFCPMAVERQELEADGEFASPSSPLIGPPLTREEQQRIINDMDEFDKQNRPPKLFE